MASASVWLIHTFFFQKTRGNKRAGEEIRAAMALRWVPVKSDTASTTKIPLGDTQEAVEEPVKAVEVGSADVGFALGQPSPKPAPSSPPDEDFMDAQDMEESKALKEAKRPPVPAASRGGPVVNFTPGHPPSWHFKQLFGRSERKDEEEVSGVFPALPSSAVAPVDQAPADPSLKSRVTPPPRPVQNSPPVSLAYSSSPHASRRVWDSSRRSSSSSDSLVGAVIASVDGRQGSKPDSTSAGGGGDGHAPASTVSSSLTTTGPSQGGEAAPAGSPSAPWFSSSSGRAGEEKAAAVSAAARGTTSGQHQHQQLGSPSTFENDIFHSSRPVPSTDPLVAASAVAAAAAAVPATEQKEPKPPLSSTAEQQQQAAESHQETSNGQQQVPLTLETSADAASPSTQTSPPAERTMSLKAAAILGVTAPEDAGNSETAAAAAAVAAADRALSVTESEGGDGGRSTPPRRGSLSRALSGSLPGDMLGRWRGKKGKVPASPRPSRSVSVRPRRCVMLFLCACRHDTLFAFVRQP